MEWETLNGKSSSSSGPLPQHQAPTCCAGWPLKQDKEGPAGPVFLRWGEPVRPVAWASRALVWSQVPLNVLTCPASQMRVVYRFRGMQGECRSTLPGRLCSVSGFVSLLIDSTNPEVSTRNVVDVMVAGMSWVYCVQWHLEHTTLLKRTGYVCGFCYAVCILRWNVQWCQHSFRSRGLGRLSPDSLDVNCLSPA